VLARSLSQLSAAYDIGGMLVSSLGGALVPLSAMPLWLRHTAPVSPGYWAVAALRAALRGEAAATFSSAAVVCGFLAGLRPGGRLARELRPGPLRHPVNRDLAARERRTVPPGESWPGAVDRDQAGSCR
jgi:hypothetical protein